jgi:hypothetical protein
MSAPYQHGSNTVVLLDGNNISGDLRASKLDGSRKAHEVLMYGATALGRQAGLFGGKVELEGLLNNTLAYTGGTQSIRDVVQAGQVLLRALFGTAVGAEAQWANALVYVDGPQEYKADELTPVKVGYECNGRIFEGPLLHGLAASETTDHTTDAVDNGAATSDGYNVQLQAVATTGSPSLAGVVQHSANGSTWATLATFATQTGVGTQILSGSGAVNRYVRLNMTLSGGTILYAVALARHQQ